MPFDSQENPHCNVAKMLAVADAIAADPLSLNMCNFVPEPALASHCGTAQCIGGWAHLLAGGILPRGVLTFEQHATQVLGLSGSTADDLFFGRGRPEGYGLSNITAGAAIKAIHNVIEKGDPDWAAVLTGEPDDAV